MSTRRDPVARFLIIPSSSPAVRASPSPRQRAFRTARVRQQRLHRRVARAARARSRRAHRSRRQPPQTPPRAPAFTSRAARARQRRAIRTYRARQLRQHRSSPPRAERARPRHTPCAARFFIARQRRPHRSVSHDARATASPALSPSRRPSATSSAPARCPHCVSTITSRSPLSWPTALHTSLRCPHQSQRTPLTAPSTERYRVVSSALSDLDDVVPTGTLPELPETNNRDPNEQNLFGNAVINIACLPSMNPTTTSAPALPNAFTVLLSQRCLGTIASPSPCLLL